MPVIFIAEPLQTSSMNLTIRSTPASPHRSRNSPPQPHTPKTALKTPYGKVTSKQQKEECKGSSIFQCCVSDRYMALDQSLQVQPTSQQVMPVPMKFVPYTAQASPQSVRTKKAISQQGHRLGLETPKTQKKGEFRHLSGKKKCKTESVNEGKELTVQISNPVSPVLAKSQQAPEFKKLEVRPFDQNVSQLKVSIQPSAPNSSMVNSVKKSRASNGRTKLTLASSFKSRIEPLRAQSQKNYLNAPSNPNTSMKVPTNTHISAPAQSLVVQESLMTARLENIYDSSLFASSELPNPSNMVYYNNLMNNSKEWKAEEVKPQSKLDRDSAPDVEYYAPKFDSGIEGKVTMRANDPSIHKQCEESDDLSEEEAYYEEADEVENMYSRLRNKKPLVQYAKTIRTVNQSQTASIHESEVLEHGTYNFPLVGPGALQPILLQRASGSVKEHIDDPETSSPKIRARNYGSVQDGGTTHFQSQRTPNAFNKTKKVKTIMEDSFEGEV